QPRALPAVMEPADTDPPGGHAGHDLHRAVLGQPVLYFLSPRAPHHLGWTQAGAGDLPGRDRADPAGDRLPTAPRAPRPPTWEPGDRSPTDGRRSGELSRALAPLAAFEEELEKALRLELGL